MMNPGMHPSKSPPFHELDEYTFQELCRDLFDAESDIATCDIYGTRGQTQYGIDLIAHRADGNGIEVGQCKCYANFTPKEIEEASDEFFKYWDERWSQENVKRFILFVACDLNRTQQQDKIIEQRKRFAKYGIKYEVWSAAKLRNKLRPHPGIVATHCKPSDHWVRTICGVVSPVSPSVGDFGAIPPVFIIVQMAMLNQVNHLASQISEEIEKRFEFMLQAWREGQRRETIEWITGIKSDDSLWPILSPQVKAKLLRFEAGLELYIRNDISRAEQLANEALKLTPLDNEARLRALIAYRKSGPKVAIEFLLGQDDVESLNLKAAFFLEMGQVNECRQALKLENVGIEPNAETFRIRALSYLVNKEVSEAQFEIQKAIEREPRWESIRFTWAIIYYFSALSPVCLPGLLPDRIFTWPEPVDWVLVKRDEESVEHLRKAAEVFHELSKRREKEEKERQTLQAWYLACLANDPERQEDAISYCCTLLQADPADYHALAWGIARNFDIQLEPSIASLKKLVTDKLANLFHIVALAGCYLVSQTPKEAITLLDDTKTIFQENQAETLWSFWYVQSLVMSGDPEATMTVIDDSKSKVELRHVQTIASQALAKKTGNWQPLIQHLEDSFKETDDPSFLFEICRLKAQQQDWDYVAERAEQLVKEFGTSEALRLAVFAAQNAGQFELCLKLLDSHQELFSQQKLPAELRRIRVSCLHVLGLVPEAIAETETLARDETTTEHLLGLANLYYSKGDLKNLVIVARQLSYRSDLTSEQALKFASQVYYKDQQLAILFWRYANKQDLPDDLVGKAVDLGYQLGLDNEMSPLLKRMWDVGTQGKGGVLVKRIEEFISYNQKWREHGAEFYESYQNGAIPIHSMMEQFHKPLVDFYHRFLEKNEVAPDPLNQVILFSRHGGHLLMPGFPTDVPKWRLNFDVTAILLAAHLGILSDVERVFQPLRIPQTLIPALIQMRTQLSHGQPSRLQIYQQIADLVERKRLKVVRCDDLPSDYLNRQLIDELGEEWVAFFEKAKAERGYLVVSLPLKKIDFSGPPTALPEDTAQYLVTCREIIESLRREGPLSEEEYEHAIERSGREERSSSRDIVPKQGVPLYCQGAIPELLAGANLLPIVCERFQVHIEQREFDRIYGELQEYKQKHTTAGWLDSLINRINKGIDDGIYQLLPLPLDKKEKFQAIQKEPPALGCLMNLMGLKAQKNDVIWIDDRLATAFIHWNGVRIIGINEVLKALVGAGALDISDYYAKVNQLRAANIRFIPFEADEILYHLRQARVDEDEGVIETKELAILRRYMAACVLQGEILQKPPVPDNVPNKNGEIAFPIVGIDRAVISALTELWTTEEDEETCLAYAGWILENLYIDHLGLRNLLSSSESEQNDLLIVSLTLAGFLTDAIGLGVHQIEEERSIRHRYLDWAFERIIKRRIRANPYLLNGIAEELKKTFLYAQENVPKEAPEDISTWILQQLYEDLPNLVKGELARDADFMAKIGIKYVTVIDIDDLHFDKDDFFQAARKTINGRKARIRPLKSKKYVIFQPFRKSEERNAFYFYHPKTKEKRIVKRNELELLLDSPSQREAVLHRHREWLDCPAEMFEQNVARIASLENPRQRIEELEKWKNFSAAVYYETLYRQLRQQQRLQAVELLPQHVDGLPRHLRLTLDIESGKAFQEALAVSVQALIDEEGFFTAIERFVGLPVPLPGILIESIAALEPQDKRMLLKRLLKICRSPISKFHFVHLLLHSGKETPAFHRLARRLIKNLISDRGAEEFEAFLAVLKWTNEELNHRAEVRNWPAYIRLTMVWAHAHRLFTIFVSAGESVARLRETFTYWNSRRVSFETFEREPAYWFDVVHPQRISRLPFLFTGLSYSLGEKTRAIVDENLRGLLAGKVMFLDEEGQPQIAFSLLRDPAQMRNCLYSFLGSDRGEVLSSLLKMNLAENFTRSALQSLIEIQLNQLDEVSDDFAPWGILREVFADLPPYKNVIDRLPPIILQTDFVHLCERDVKSGMLITKTVSLQLDNFHNEELRLYLKDQVMNIAQLFAKRFEDVNLTSLSQEDSENLDRISDFLIEFARNIALAVQPPLDVVEEFVEILTQLVETWNFMSRITKPLVLTLIEELPIAQAQKFWPLLIRLRAS